jgi:hypothetical protein
MLPDENKIQGNIEWLKTYGLDLEDVVSCDTVGCVRPATHYARVGCCGAVIIGCEPCLHDAYRTVLYMIKEHKAITCQGCGKHNRPEGWLSKPEKLSLL